MDRRARWWTGAAGLSTLAITLAVMPLHFVYDAAPPVGVAATRGVLNGVTCIGLLVFLTGIRHLARRDPVAEPAATLALTAGTVFVALTMAADAMHLGSALLAGGGMDPTRVGGGAEAAIVLLGPTARLLTAVVVAAAGTALVRAALVPRSVGAAAAAVSLGQLALVPTAWSGADPATFYDINGWGVAVAGGVFVSWLAFAGLALLRGAPAGHRRDVAALSPDGSAAPAQA